jgi:hypothetical protein
MKNRILQSIALGMFVMFFNAFACPQNGPTPAQAVATWTQAVATPTSGAVTANSVYRCTVTTGSTCTPAPTAIFTSTIPITTYTDTSIVSGSTYVYAVTAHFGSVEGPYSNLSNAYTWAFSAPTFGTVTGSLLMPQAQAETTVAEARAPMRVLLCSKCSLVSNLVVRRR